MTISPFLDTSGTRKFTAGVGDWVQTVFGPARVTHAEDREWRHSQKRMRRLICTVPANAEFDETKTVELLHPDFPERWPVQLQAHDFDPVLDGCRSCGALPGDDPVCEPPTPLRKVAKR